ncbi:MAG: molybdopterin dehydrogenase FAD-binding protein, partial [Hyphomicrobiales bacterium]|nr:molybdopterin dehydrogenase FAD-binding protein [Hyphomicrobiales bacterium]
MKPTAFTYVPVASLAEALAAKAQHGEDARFLAGGQSLVPTMNFRLAQPRVLIDIGRVSELAFVTHAPDATHIGAVTTYRTLERDAALLARFPVLADALPLIAHAQIRSRGTLGGNLSHADPASEMPAVMLALDARLKVASAEGVRWIAARDFFLGPLTTALEPNDLLVEIMLPAPPPDTGMAFLEVARRRGDFAVAGVATVVTLKDGVCTAARIALCGVADCAVLASASEALVGVSPDAARIAAVASAVAAALDPPGGLQASPGYQRHLANVLTARALTC